MKVSVDQYCINVSDLEKSVEILETHGETPEVSGPEAGQ